jgi:hypothetical protein
MINAPPPDRGMSLRRLVLATLCVQTLTNVLSALFRGDVTLAITNLAYVIATGLFVWAHLADYRTRRMRVVLFHPESGESRMTLAAVPRGWPAGKTLAVIAAQPIPEQELREES